MAAILGANDGILSTTSTLPLVLWKSP